MVVVVVVAVVVIVGSSSSTSLATDCTGHSCNLLWYLAFCRLFGITGENYKHVCLVLTGKVVTITICIACKIRKVSK